MNNELIKTSVKREVNNWVDIDVVLSRRKLTPKAIDFIAELIINIKDDPSPLWNNRIINLDDEFQRRAISLIPEALDYILLRRPALYLSAEISTWEIWNSLTGILVRFCFIPEKDM